MHLHHLLAKLCQTVKSRQVAEGWYGEEKEEKRNRKFPPANETKQPNQETKRQKKQKLSHNKV